MFVAVLPVSNVNINNVSEVMAGPGLSCDPLSLKQILSGMVSQQLFTLLTVLVVHPAILFFSIYPSRNDFWI